MLASTGGLEHALGAVVDSSQLLMEKARLLILRERELFSLRRRYQRRGAWLDLTRSLPESIDPRGRLGESLDRVCAELVRVLGVQRAHCHLLDRERGIAPLVEDDRRAEFRGLAASAAEVVFGSKLGSCALPDDSARTALGQALGLALFVWYRVDRDPESSLLLVAGFDAARSDFHDPFDAEDVESFGNFGHHVELLVQNRSLLVRLEQDKRELARFNQQLEQQVETRTSELATTLSELRDRELRINEDIDEAQRFQSKFLPDPIKSDRIEVRWVFEPLERVGGDIFDVAELAPGRFRILLADATGHGVQASMRTMVLKSEYERMKTRQDSPSTVLSALNERLTALFPGGEMLCTGCCLDVEAGDGQAQVTYANAAHPPLLYWAGGRLRELWTIGPFLGVSRRAAWPPPATFQLGAGDVLLAYSDGLTEQRDPTGKIFESTLKALQPGDLPLEDGVQLIMTRLDRFRGAHPREDDLTLVAMRVR